MTDGTLFDLTTLEELPALAKKEAAGLVEFINAAKIPALVIAAFDAEQTELDVKPAYRSFTSAVGSPEAIVNLVAWLSATVMPALTKGNADEDAPTTVQ